MSTRHYRFAGFTLIELMVAMTIGMATVVAALEVLARVQDVYRVNERVARLQEQGRSAFATVEPDFAMAGFYGFSQAAERIRFIRDGSRSNVVASALALRQFP